jgi:hypothetical protein
VRVSDDKDVTSHIDPKPCVGAREGDGEASVGACAGQPLSLENILSGADTLRHVEGNMSSLAIVRANSARRGRRTWHAQKFLAREPGDLGTDLHANARSASGRQNATSR